MKRCVYAKAKNIPNDHREEIAQETMYRVAKYLPEFRFQCALKTWLNTLIKHCIIDERRHWKYEGQFTASSNDLPNENDREGEGFNPSKAKSTTLAKELEARLKINKYHLDRLFWAPGWQAKTRDTRIDILDRLVMEKEWIIEGTYLTSYKSRLDEADTIIFLDMPFWLCPWRLIKRLIQYRGQPRRDIPEGCTDKLTLFLMLKVLLFPLQHRRKLKRELHRYRSYNKSVFELSSQRKVDEFLARQKQVTSDKSERTVAAT